MWYRRPEESGARVDSRWLGPSVVIKRVGESSFEVEVKDGKVVVAPAMFLKPYTEDTAGPGIPLFYHQRTVVEEHGDIHDFIVENVLAHKIENGVLKFKIKWQGYGEDESTWDDSRQFVWGINSLWREYCAKHRLKVDLVGDVEWTQASF